MIQQIYITDYLSDAASRAADVVQGVTMHCPMLLKADWEVIPVTPLKALFNALQHSEHTPPAISQVSAVLKARQVWASVPPAFSLLPVHLGLQRDTFSLRGTVPMPAEVYAHLTETLQQHFVEDFIVHTETEQRFWWIQPLKRLEVECSWPQDCLYQQAFQWQPQGEHAALIRQWTNESQMLLHQMSAGNLPGWPEQLNSLWFASVPDLPVWKHEWQIVYGSGAVFDGLLASQLPLAKQISAAEVFKDKAIRKAMMVVDQLDEIDWQTLFSALQQGRISTLEVVLPFAERSVRVTYKKCYRWQFWRKAYTVQRLLEKLESALPTFKVPEAA